MFEKGWRAWVEEGSRKSSPKEQEHASALSRTAGASYSCVEGEGEAGLCPGGLESQTANSSGSTSHQVVLGRVR